MTPFSRDPAPPGVVPAPPSVRRGLRQLTLALLLVVLAPAACSRNPPPVTPAPEIPADDVVAQRATSPAPSPVAPAPAPRPVPSPPLPAAPAPESPAPEPSTPDPPAAGPLATGPLATGPLATGPPAAILRVGLATDLEQVTLPCCTGAVGAQVGDRRLDLVSPMRVEAAADATGGAFFRLQVAALRDAEQAEAMALKVGRRMGQPADARFDAASGLYKVRLGRYAEREAAERGLRALETAGMAGAWVVSEGGGVERPALLVHHGGESHRVEGRWLVVDAAEGGAVSVDGKRYRGRLLVYLNDRGRLNLINELSLEDYLRGVVPKEMGPLVYDQIEALKAQAVAARSYTLSHLGEFSSEGYDLCATPRCHVYGGMDAEHPVTDRALAETAGEVVLYQGQIADTLYTATCGGHTEDVEKIFPGLGPRPYLRGVSCSEAGSQPLAGGRAQGAAFPAGLTRDLLPLNGGLDPRGALEQRLRQLAHLAGLPLPDDQLVSLERREVQRFVASVFDLALDARLFVAAEDIPYLLEDPPAEWDEEALRQAAYLAASGLFSGEVTGSVDADEVEGLLLNLAVLLHVVREEPASFQRLEGGQLVVRQGSEAHTYPLPGGLPGFRMQGDRTVGADLRLVAGDRLRLYLRGDRLVGLVQEVDSDGVAYDRRSKRASWTRFRTDRELAALVRERYPGLSLRRFEILERGDSGRVTRLALIGEGAQRVEVEGLAVRWTLDLPETLFTATRLTPADGPAGWLFRGKGWGHGVGMCQEGAFGMALRGYSYRDILGHYYSGTHVGPFDPRSLRTVAGSPAR